MIFYFLFVDLLYLLPCSGAPIWLSELLRSHIELEVQRLREERQLERERQLFRREVTLKHVNATLESFAFPNGIREYLKVEAVRLGLRGYVQRVVHSDVKVVLDGTWRQLEQYQLVLLDLKSRIVCGSLQVGVDMPLYGHVYDDFHVELNARKDCTKLPQSDGELWEKLSSSVGSEL